MDNNNNIKHQDGCGCGDCKVGNESCSCMCHKWGRSKIVKLIIALVILFAVFVVGVKIGKEVGDWKKYMKDDGYGFCKKIGCSVVNPSGTSTETEKNQ